MSVSRRTFIQLGSVAAAIASVPVSLGAQDARTAAMRKGVDPSVADAPLRKSPGSLPTPQAIRQAVSKAATLTQARFETEVGSTFVVQAGSQAIGFTLISVTGFEPASASVSSMAVPPPRPTKATPQVSSFTLRFQSSTPDVVPQGTYRFQHGTLGTLDLFIVPAAVGQQTYTAVVSQIGAAVTARRPDTSFF